MPLFFSRTLSVMSSSEESSSESHSPSEGLVKTPSKPAAKRAAKPAPPKPAPSPAPTKDHDDQLKLCYTWEEAKKLVGVAWLEKLYGKPPGPLPYVVRDAIGNGLCPFVEGQRDFYLPPEDVNAENCREQFEVVAARLPKASASVRIVEAWLAFAKKKGYLETFRQASELMTAEIRAVEAARSDPRPTPPPVKAVPIPADLKRKDVSGVFTEAPPSTVLVAPPVAKPAAPPTRVAATTDAAAAAAAQESEDHPVQTLSDMRRKMYRKTDTNIISPGFAISSVIASRSGGGSKVSIDDIGPVRPRYNSPVVQAMHI